SSSHSLQYGVRSGSSLDRPLLELTETFVSGPTRVVNYDVLGRSIVERVVSRGDGQQVIVEQEYDSLGRGTRSLSLPHFASEAPRHVRYEYDNVGRLLREHGADGTTVEYRYQGLTTSR